MGIITSTGVDLPTLAENTADVSDLYSEYTGEYDLAASSAGGELISIQSEMVTLFKQDIADAVASNQVENATETNLEYLAAVKNQTRLTNQQSTAYLKFTNSSDDDILVEAGTSFTSSENDEAWTLNYDVTVPANDSAYGSVTSENYSISASAETIDIDTQVAGLTVTNNGSATVGDEEESDADLRERLQTIGTPYTYNLKVGLYLALIELDNVASVNIEDNNTSAEVNNVPAKSFEVTVSGGNRAEIAKVIHTYTGCGSASYGDLSQLVKADDGNTYLVYFSEPTETIVTIAVTLTTTDEYDSDSGDETVRDLLIDLVDSLDIGDNLYIQYCESVCLVAGVTNVALTLNGGSVSLFAGHKERFVTSSSYVSVSS